MSGSPVLLVDGTGLLVRSSRAGGRSGMHAGSEPTGTLTVFINALTSRLRTYDPGHVLVAFDGAGSRRWRQKLWPPYKADRPDPPGIQTREFRQVTSFCETAGIGVVLRDGYEADDLIAWAVRMADLSSLSVGSPVVIVSDDADLHQLIKVGVTQVPLTGRPIELDTDGVMDRYGVRPEWLVYLRALAGDRTDGVPGISGVGPVKARKMIEGGHRSLSVAIDKLHPDDKPMVGVFEGILSLSHAVLLLEKDYPEMNWRSFLEMSRWDHPDTESVTGFLERYQMVRALDRLEAGCLW